MSNVLPQEVRRRVSGMYYARFGSVAALILLGIAFIAGLALIPSYFALRIGDNTPAQKKPASSSQQDDRNAVLHGQALLSTLSPLLSTTTTTALVADALASRPATVQIYHITATSGNPGTIILAGAAGSIEAISKYQSALQADTHFSSVSIPVGDLAGTANGQFSITLSANF